MKEAMNNKNIRQHVALDRKVLYEIIYKSRRQWKKDKGAQKRIDIDLYLAIRIEQYPKDKQLIKTKEAAC